MNVSLPKDTFDRLVFYLSKCPFGEVENLVNELRVTVKAVVEPSKEGGDVSNVQSSETDTASEAPTSSPQGQEVNGEEAKSDNQG